MQSGKNRINNLKTLSWSLCGLWVARSHFCFMLLICTGDAEVVDFFSPRKTAHQLSGPAQGHQRHCNVSQTGAN